MLFQLLNSKYLLQRARGLVTDSWALAVAFSTFTFMNSPHLYWVIASVLKPITISALSYSVFACYIFSQLLLSCVIMKLWILKSEFHTHFHLSYNIFLFLFFSAIYNINTIPSLWTLQNPTVGEVSLWGIISPNPYYITQNKVSPI